MNDDPAFEGMARALEATGEYKVLRRLKARPPTTPPPDASTRIGIMLDVETTGLDPRRDEIIELAMTPFSYGLDGVIFSVGEPFSRLREPTLPIPPEITAITGINHAMVAGQRIDPAEVAAFAAPAALIIAHNAAFDRSFVERMSEVFITKPWACSMSQVDWAAEGFEGTKLSYLAGGAGFFYERHRAHHDCMATIELLATRLPISGVTALTRLLEVARVPTWRIWAENSPFEFKDVLKARGYRWNGDSDPRPRAWYIDVADTAKEAELHFLRSEIYRGEINLIVRRVNAHDRFSERC